MLYVGYDLANMLYVWEYLAAFLLGISSPSGEYGNFSTNENYVNEST